VVALNKSDTGNGVVNWDCEGSISSLGNNLVGTVAGCGISLLSSDLSGEPYLDSFTDAGLPGAGHYPLLPTSPLINAANNSACSVADQLGQPRVGQCDIGSIEYQPSAVAIQIEIQPRGSDTPPISPARRGIIRVAILTNALIAAIDIDPGTVRFGRTGTEATASRPRLEDVDRDGDLDLIVFFMAEDTAILCGDEQVHLRAGTFAGQLLHGSSAIETVGCRP